MSLGGLGGLQTGQRASKQPTGEARDLPFCAQTSACLLWPANHGRAAHFTRAARFCNIRLPPLGEEDALFVLTGRSLARRLIEACPSGALQSGRQRAVQVLAVCSVHCGLCAARPSEPVQSIGQRWLIVARLHPRRPLKQPPKHTPHRHWLTS